MSKYKKALECLEYIMEFVDYIEDKSHGATGTMLDKNGNIMMRADIGYWEEGNRYLKSYLIKKVSETKSIPIEWIKQWCNRSENTYSKADVVDMLTDWEKENEADRQE